jgi:phosphoribosylamine-glycine ligase
VANGGVVTSGGRVLGVTAVADSLQQALDRAYQAHAEIHFEGIYLRRDIGHRELSRTK